MSDLLKAIEKHCAEPSEPRTEPAVSATPSVTPPTQQVVKHGWFAKWLRTRIGRIIWRRLHQASTWRAIVGLITAGSIALTPEHVERLVALGLATIGAIGLFTDDGVLGANSELD